MEPLSTLIRDFTAAYPAMTITADAAFTPEEVVQAVKAGRAELGLLGAASSPHTGGLRVLPIEDQTFVLISPPQPGEQQPVPGERAEDSGRVTVARDDLAGVRLVVSKQGSLMRELVDDVLASGVDARIVVEVEHRTSILPMVLAGVGHAVMPTSWAPLAERAGAVVRNIESSSLLRIALVFRTTALTPAARAFVECVESYASERRASGPAPPHDR
jgi:DNA-binding transcriptional LysR family regulator